MLPYDPKLGMKVSIILETQNGGTSDTMQAEVPLTE
jgi:hypothetical protein